MKNNYINFGKNLLICIILLQIQVPQIFAQYKEITLSKAGTISELINEDEKWVIKELKVSGPVNASDFVFMREMTGADLYGTPTNGNTEKIDLTKAEIIGWENTPYEEQGFYIANGINYVIAEDNYFSGILFYKCDKLKELILPEKAKCNYLSGIKNLHKISVPEENQNLCVIENILYSKNMESLIYCPPFNLELGDFKVHEKVRYIKNSAFANNQSLTSIDLANTDSIFQNAFFSTENLESIKIGKNLKYISATAFYYCPKLKTVTVDNENASYSAKDNILYSKDFTKLYLYPEKTEIENSINEKVKNIESYAVTGRQLLRDFTVPDNVDSIKQLSIQYCPNLENINIGKNTKYIHYSSAIYLQKHKYFNVDANNQYYKSIGGNIYSKDGKTFIVAANGIEELYVEEGTETLDSLCFAYCHSLKEITLPSTLKKINLLISIYNTITDIYIKATTPPESKYILNIGNPNIYVPKESYEQYKSSSTWKNLNIIPYDYSGVEHIKQDYNLYEIKRYNIDGRVLENPERGINIIIMSDGSIKKELVK